jgi:hypothetical protein
MRRADDLCHAITLDRCCGCPYIILVTNTQGSAVERTIDKYTVSSSDIINLPNSLWRPSYMVIAFSGQLIVSELMTRSRSGKYLNNASQIIDAFATSAALLRSKFPKENGSICAHSVATRPGPSGASLSWRSAQVRSKAPVMTHRLSSRSRQVSFSFRWSFLTNFVDDYTGKRR